MLIFLANDSYEAFLQTTFNPGENTFSVDNVPLNVPTILVSAPGTNYEAVFSVTGKTVNSLTGVTRIRGYNGVLIKGTVLTCLNNEEFINQYRTYLGIDWKGEYVALTAYVTGDGVSYNGTSYVCVADSTGNLPTDTNYWQVLTSKGDTGATGATGETGAAGADGLGVPAGGSTGEALIKTSGINNNTEWKNLATKIETLTNKTLTSPKINEDVALTATATQLNNISISGLIQMYGGSSAPTGWLLCNGAAISRTTYSALFAVISTTYGVGDNFTTFNLPDFRGVFPKGAGTTDRTLGKDASGNYYAATLGTYSTDKFQGHYHTLQYDGLHTDWNSWTDYGQIRGNNGAGNNIGTTGPKSDGTNGTPRTGLTTEPQSLGINFIIKT